MKKLQPRIKLIKERLSAGLAEREETISVALLCALAQQNAFLFGPPGTAKSLIARRLSKVFQQGEYFEYLMQRFSTPEDVFGPVSIQKLKEDIYQRQVNGYLPTADVAFLDEIWKSSPAILNTLLTIINEKKFKNGNEIINVPLKFLISASNEIPDANQGLDALFDRFLVRLYVKPIESRENFESILATGALTDDIDLPSSYEVGGEKFNVRISNEEYSIWQKQIHEVKISKNSFDIIQEIRVAIQDYNKENKTEMYVSDRRWQRAALLMKASAFFNDRDETNAADCLLLSYCLWSDKEQYEAIKKIVNKAVENSSISTSDSYSDLQNQLKELDKKVDQNCYYQEDLYDTIVINKKPYVKIKIGSKVAEVGYIPKVEVFRTDVANNWSNFIHPVNSKGEELSNVGVLCGNGMYSVKARPEGREFPYRNYGIDYDYNITYNKNDQKLIPTGSQLQRKPDINPYIINGLSNDCQRLIEDWDSAVKEAQSKYDSALQQIETPFLLKGRLVHVVSGYSKIVKDCEKNRQECDIIMSKIKGE